MCERAANIYRKTLEDICHFLIFVKRLSRGKFLRCVRVTLALFSPVTVQDGSWKNFLKKKRYIWHFLFCLNNWSLYHPVSVFAGKWEINSMIWFHKFMCSKLKNKTFLWKRDMLTCKILQLAIFMVRRIVVGTTI